MISTLTRAGLLALMRPDKYVRMGVEIRRAGITATTGISLASVRCPNRPALVDELGAMTWRELDESCNALAVALLDLGTRPDAKIGLLCRNHRGFVQSLAAIGRIGADTVLLNTSFAGPQLAAVVAREGVDLLIHDEEFAPIVSAIDGPRTVVAWTDEDAPEDNTLTSLIAARTGRRPPRPERSGRIVLLTSGTTGTPKGASRPGGGDIGNLVSVLDRIPWRAEETVVVAAPMFHAWGFGQLLIGATMACTVVMTRRFDPEETLALVEKHRATGLAVVPVMIERIMDLAPEIRRRYELSSLRFVTASGSRMRPSAVTGFIDEFGDVIYNSYNATEAGMISIATPADLRVSSETAGRPILGTQIRLLDESGAEVPLGHVGHIHVLNETRFDGYTNGETKAHVDGYIASGDMGRVDENGRLYVVGREDDMIVSGGENVFPLEVEQCLAAHPGVRDAVCVGVEDESFGQRLDAWIVSEKDASVTADELRNHVKSQLASYKAPRNVTFIKTIPRNAAGKIDRKQLVGGSA